MSHRQIFLVLPVAHQIKILNSYQGYATQFGAKKIQSKPDQNLITWFDNIEDNYNSLSTRDRKSVPVTNTRNEYHTAIKRSYCELAALCLRLNRRIPGDHDPVARSVIGRITSATHYKYEFTKVHNLDQKTTNCSSETFLPSSSSCNDSNTINSMKQSIGDSTLTTDRKHRKPVFKSAASIPSAPVQLQPKWVYCDSYVTKVQPRTVEAVAFQVIEDVESACDQNKSDLTNTTSNDQSTQTEISKFSIQSVLPRLSSKIRRVIVQALNGTILPLSTWEIRRYCAIIYRTLRCIPAKTIRREVYKCFGISKNVSSCKQ